jgi:hypothetical protein
MKAFRSLLVLAAALFPVLNAPAAEMRFNDMWKEGDRYYLRSESYIEAPPGLVFETLLDYENFYRISGGIKETRFLAPDADGRMRAYSRVESCVLFFCRSVEKVEHVTVVSEQEIVLDSIPELSDFRYNHSRWLIRPEGTGTRLGFEMDMEPDFWIPPLVGPWAIKMKLESSAMTMARRVEEMARTGRKLTEFNIK